MEYLVTRDWDDTLHVTPQQLVYATAAPIFLGFTTATALWGVACAQGVMYFKRDGRQDGPRIKAVVVILLLLELFHFTVTAHATYESLIIFRMNYLNLNDPTWSLLAQAVPSALIVLIVRYVWTMRVWALSKSWVRNIIAIAMILLSFGEAGLTVGWMSAEFTAPYWGEIYSARWGVLAVFFLRAFNDLSAASLFCCYLNRSKNGFEETDSIIRKLIRYGLGAGLFTSLGSIALVIVLALLPRQAWFMSVYLTCTRVYVISLLAMLHWRRAPSKFTKEPAEEGIELSTMRWAWSPYSTTTGSGSESSPESLQTNDTAT
ncbi:hypothetical protein FIBSPDRAFT_1038560 [Athelia psychrophila]|uniref:DUF6534 domain-containing protein n=1 Tax=Athelia psychrophila TaxID=1759441 RepID=A0A166SUE6_9AGAM|nr:hypothetical protein FIBSPDRAFT_1038560 [Fibularhizoctonia sp. CBS 109695]